jgi:hypothetical protein
MCPTVIPNIYTLSRILVTTDGVRLVNIFIDHLQVVTTNSYQTIADVHTTHHSTLSIFSLLSLVIAW